MGVEERKPRIGGSIPNDLSFCPSPLLFPYFLLQAVTPTILHITQDNNNNDKASRPATLDQQNKVVFFPLHGGEGN